MCLCVFTVKLQAAPAISNRTPIHITADHFHFNQSTGIGVYTGRVHVTQGVLTIKGNRLTVIAPPNEPVEHLRMDGSPATFHDVTPKGKTVNGHAQHMHYLPNKHLVQLEGQAKLIQSRNTFSSNHIIYNTQSGVVIAGSPGNRVKATLVPQKQKDQKRRQQAP